MKIAKKVLAVVMAIAMVACFAAVSFAAEGKVTLKVSEIVDGKFKVAAVATDYADLGDANWVVTYDAAALKCSAVGNGTNDLAQIATDTVALAVMQSKLITAYNNEKDGEIQVGFAFEGTLGSAAETVLFTMDFELEDADAKNIEIKLTGTDEATVVVNEEAEEAPSTEAPSTEAPSTQAPTTAPGKDDGDNKTGDTGVLAIAAGVVALAGAAFVVSKKRK